MNTTKTSPKAATKARQMRRLAHTLAKVDPKAAAEFRKLADGMISRPTTNTRSGPPPLPTSLGRSPLASMVAHFASYLELSNMQDLNNRKRIMRAGTSIAQSAEVLAKSTKDSKLRALLADVHDDVMSHVDAANKLYIAEQHLAAYVQTQAKK